MYPLGYNINVLHKGLIIMLNNKTVCIFHQKSELFFCPDGITSAAIANKFLPIDEFIAGTHNNNEEIINKIGVDNTIYFVDYSMKVKEIEILGERNNVIVIDHHKSAQNELSQVSSGIRKFFNMRKSGAGMTWDLLSSDTRPAFVDYIENGDLYLFDLPKAKEVCAGIYTLLSSPVVESLDEIFQKLESFWGYSQEKLINYFEPLGIEAKKIRDEKVAKLSANAYPQTIKGAKVLVVEIDESEANLASSIGYKLYTDNPEIDFAVIACTGTEQVFVSFRSDQKGNNFDCESIAKSFGGGGHRNACGCTVKNLTDLFD